MHLDQVRQAFLHYSLGIKIAILFVFFGLTLCPVEAATSEHYEFAVSGVLEEASSMGTSWSPYWWVNSGAKLILQGGIGSTIIGTQPAGTAWRLLYNLNNPLDTQGGMYPQNIFRLVNRKMWSEPSVELKFKVAAIHTTDTPNRDGYSGILLMSRYQDGNNLYYAGIRMDGHAVIKRKRGGTYTTLAEKQVFAGTYSKDSNPNLIPTNKWMRLKSVVDDITGGTSITLYLDRANNGVWEKIASVVDTNPITGTGHTGIRTDYMDAYFDDYKVTEL